MLCILFLANGLFAQSLIDKVEVIQGPIKKQSMKYVFIYGKFLGSDGSNIYGKVYPTARMVSGTTGSTEVKLFSVDKNLKPSEGVTQDNEIEKKDSWDEFNVMLGGKQYVFYSFQNQKLRKSILFARRVNNKSLLQEGEPKVVAEVDYSKSNKYKTATFDYSLSPDSTKLLISYGLLNKERMLVGFGFNVLNNDMDILWGKENELPSTANKVYGLEKYCLNNDGEVFLLCKIFDTKKDFKNSIRYKSRFLKGADAVEVPNFSYTVFSYRDKGNDNKENKLELSGQFIRALTIQCAPSGGVVCAGLYAEKESLSAIGSCSFVIPETGDVKVSHSEFDTELLVKGMKKGDAEDVRSAISDKTEFEECLYTFPDLVFRSDGGFWMAGEQTKSNIKSTNNGTTQTFYSNSVYVSSFAADGSIVWTNKLYKEQKTTSYYFVFSSIKLHAIDNNLFILYNNIVTNAMGGISFGKTKALLTEYTEKGTETSRELAGISKSDMVIFPSYALSTDPYSLYTLGQDGLKYCFIKLRFKK